MRNETPGARRVAMRRAAAIGLAASASVMLVCGAAAQTDPVVPAESPKLPPAAHLAFTSDIECSVPARGAAPAVTLRFVHEDTRANRGNPADPDNRTYRIEYRLSATTADGRELLATSASSLMEGSVSLAESGRIFVHGDSACDDYTDPRVRCVHSSFIFDNTRLRGRPGGPRRFVSTDHREGHGRLSIEASDPRLAALNRVGRPGRPATRVPCRLVDAE